MTEPNDSIPEGTSKTTEPHRGDEAFDPREMYPLIFKAAAAAGWEDPLMDEYDRYDEIRRKTN